MFKQEIKLIFRGLKRQIVTSSINIIGLAIGFTFVILAGVYAFSELSFDHFHKNREAIYRVEFNTPDREVCSSSGNTSSWIKNNIPEVKYATRILKDEIMGITRNVVYKETRFIIENPLIVDNDFFKMFSFQLLSGEINSFQRDKYSVALTESLSQKIFGNENPIGKAIEYKGEMFTVSAVMEEVPQNSSIRFDILLPAENLPSYVSMNWGNNNVQTFIQSDEHVSRALLEQKIQNGIIAELNSLGYPEQIRSRIYHLNPLDNIYYSSSANDQVCEHGNRKTTLMLISLVSIVLLIALLNYANTILSGASESIKRIGIRTVNGSSRANNIRFLVYQAIMPSIIAVTIAFLVSQPVKHILGNLLNVNMPDLKFTYFLVALLVAMLTGTLVGLFPAIKFTSYKITSSLKNSNDSGRKVNRLGNVFTIAQFAASIALIISVFTIYKQLNFVFAESNNNLTDEAIIYMPIANRSAQTAPTIKMIEEALKQLPEIEYVSTSLHIPGDEHYSDRGIQLVKNGEKEAIVANNNMVGIDYPEIMNFKMVEGRSFDPNIKSDYQSYIVNEAFISTYDIQDISSISLNDSPIIGVMKDFHYNSLHDRIKPLAIRYEEFYQSRIVVKLASSNTSLIETVNKITKATDEIDKTAVTDVLFLDQHIAKLYDKEIQVSNILLVLALFSIFISGMGLFSMSMLISKIRTKEIGIRKVNGAKVSEILSMLNKDFLKWVTIAFVIATPIAYYAMRKWLENFAYKTNLSWWIFALAGVLALGIALLTVSWQSWRAATRNPVEALRYE
ncbi:ABC transporter permease [uncultured Draconibacterium sp.]|uniref:ABC transporter permease n=1 Tax=uncultured Draconibacterium sp. TaxID=1573823 RepID=UPI002AA8DBA8|nr:ABC transporter permease [uncultured Draconibacterium sp.]